ncbi:secreted RxLR effector peptide protein, putative [Phytophthora infestans T30-4]|uniref:RxLR effector protein CRE4 n=2 Tax=Phytophthora infestans TaxID=4787 RepID=CRE4_PHYIT|nr:secreted RxLR effector peptide protein, putative [Phytophthora infestans T30-4]D0N607.1 RecName: Full=RxLR effector protein CRE4; AltName: Full=Core RXLR effector 4; Flags: Precursor [Phytophthora infestans T30-4]EEY70498.1 secreted RxLR effector peptide protein, putative [Phytophthora infestans T30-4]KAF4046464.1 hypothetical protein GN244_ATG00851 [Phytophthora infestans]KAF4135721.1 hypothetical protein GN958_ATG15087 [Phytophthora infestans]|eukprot:XP_002998152.1 secreted RxLR effector peptide protein, putative [Phytophthora infestans T30-4]
MLRSFLLIVATVSLFGQCKPLPLATSPVSDAVRAPHRSTHETRFVRTNDEERGATMTLAGVLRDKAQTKQLLTSWLNSGKSVPSVSNKLGLKRMSLEQAIHHENWKALTTFQRMKSKKAKAYAKYGTGYQTEAKTKENLLQWVMRGDSPKEVSSTLGLLGLSRRKIIDHQNYEAFRTFLKYRKQWAEMQGNGFTKLTT